MKLMILASLFLSAHAKLAVENWQIKSGSLNYHVSFPIKDIDGVSENVKGKGHCAEKICEFLVAAPVNSFVSGDGNRDNHMLEVTRAAMNPMIVVKVTFVNADSVEAKAEVQFAGKSHTYEHIQISPRIKNGEIKTSGRVPLKLSDFDVDRPSLLTVKIEDTVPVDFDLNWAIEKQ
jgi:hypothetical protein